MLTRTLFPKEILYDLEKKDGYIAIALFAIYFSFSFIYTYIFRDFLLGTKCSKELGRLISGLGFYMFPLIVIFTILKIRNQSFGTIGFRRKGFISSVLIGLTISMIVFINHLVHGRALDTVIYNMIFYVFILGFSEEILFRGFLWPRLVVCFGETFGTILSGMIFGIMHAPMQIVLNGSPIIMGMLNQIGGGIVGSLLFIFIYTRNKNIVLPSFIHGAIDFMQ